MVERKKIIKPLGIILLFLSVSALLNFRIENILEPDSLYHIRHAWLYGTNGLFDSSFPWIEFSVINEAGADLWYGFHLFLVPFTYINNLIAATKISSFSITFLFLILCYWALRNIQIKLPELWITFFALSSPSIMQRITFTRPHPLSLALTALILSFFYRGSAMLIFIFSFVSSWIHSALFWLPLLVGIFVLFFNRLTKQKNHISKFLALLAGLGAGLAVRPHPIANLKLIYIQIVDLYFLKGYELAQTIGGELRPPTWNSALDQKWLFTLFIIALIYFLRHAFKKVFSDNKAVIFSSLALTVFSVFMYMTAKRAIDQLGLFIIIFAGVVLTPIFSSGKKYLGAVLLICFLTGVSVYNLAYPQFGPSHSPTKFKESALWLKENTNKKEVVFYLNWGYFPFLFFWNQNNHYINGMDPVFLFKHDQALYWKLYNMAVNENDKEKIWKLSGAADTSGLTCGRDPKKCRPEDIEAVPDVLRNDFHASYVFVLTKTKGLANYLEKDKKNFEKVFEDKEESATIYKILPE